MAIVALVCGFAGAQAVARWANYRYAWHMRLVFSQIFNIGLVPGLALFLGSFAFLTVIIWRMKKPILPLLNRIDMAVMLVAVMAVLRMCYQMVDNIMLTPWEVLQGFGNISAETFVVINLSFFSQDLIIATVVAYIAGAILFLKFIEHIRDRNIVMHWYAFVKKHPFWPGGIFALVMLAFIVYVIFVDVPVPVFAAAIVVLLLSSFFAEFLLNLSQLHDKANAEKVKAEQFKAELITNVSHDIKTPLTSIINYVDLLKHEGLEGQAAEHLQVLERKSARLKVLIDDLMEASKAGTGNMKVDLREIDLGELVGQIAGEFEDSLATSGLALVLRQPDGAVLVETDSRHLYRVLENLFSNAAKYALSGTRVFVDITQMGNKTQIVMQNTSATPVNLSDGEATEQFMRGDKSRQTEGSGLGLYIAKSLIELMGGEFVIKISGDLFRVEIAI